MMDIKLDWCGTADDKIEKKKILKSIIRDSKT